MKNTKVCPKCESKNIIRIPANTRYYGLANNIPAGWFNVIPVTRYLCAECGYIEEWIDSPQNIAKLADTFEKWS